MTPWKRARYQAMCYFSELMLGLAFSLAPSGSKEEIAMCHAIQTYHRELSLWQGQRE